MFDIKIKNKFETFINAPFNDATDKFESIRRSLNGNSKNYFDKNITVSSNKTIHLYHKSNIGQKTKENATSLYKDLGESLKDGKYELQK
ncbi:MAG: hypothetical protein U0457_13895 [Candidatus Sericytochromatia bacterium]